MQSKLIQKSSLILFPILFLGISMVFEIPAYSNATKTPTFTPIATPTIVTNDSQIEILEVKVQNLETNVQTQSEAYAATVTRMEANMNVLLAVMAVASLLVAFLGFGVVKIWIRQLVEERIQKALSQEVNELAQKEADRIRAEWDPKFASLYEEYRKTIARK